jgi:hypothetical protein
MSRTTYLGFVGMLILLSCSMGLGEEQLLSNNPASLQVTILDENGSLFHSAHIYIFSSNKKEFFGTREAYGTTTFDLPPGDYRIYAGMTLKNDGIVDHYASPEASVRISTDEPTSVILSLQRAEDGEMTLSDSARQKLDIDPELAKNLN